ncbi:MAG TPA: 2-isopropylmalate synthase [Oleiagrimonas sp.]|nr:2-isopropylmalate synthase [Oleiagrimonas sp.]
MPQTKQDAPEDDVREHVRIFDTTLRDGEQAPGFSMNRAQKLRMAEALGELGVDVMEAGFAAASPDDFAAVKAIAESVRTPSICSLARCVPGDVEAAAKALEGARAPRLHLFLSTSPLHREHKLRMSKQQVLDTTVKMVTRARELCDDVEFSPEDGMRTEPDFLIEVLNAAVEAGARTLNVPDTVGYMTPTEIAERFRFMRANVRNADKVVFSAHCHDDLGMAVANSMAAIEGGARQVECAINGIGERAGNASLEEIVMALRVRGAHYGVTTDLDTRRLYPVSRQLAQITGQHVQRNKAIVGANAFAHESGIHQHGVLRHPGTYEIMRAEDVGVPPTPLTMGKHSGRAALRKRLEELGFKPDEAKVDDLFARFKRLADRKREVYDGDLEALALGRDPEDAGPWRISQLHTNSHFGSGASAAVTLQHEDGRVAAEAAIGDGPVDAVLRALQRATGDAVELTDFRVDAVSEGGDAQGRVSINVRYEGRQWRGHGFSTDIVEASAQAALDVLNRVARSHNHVPHPAKESA